MPIEKGSFLDRKDGELHKRLNEAIAFLQREQKKQKIKLKDDFSPEHILPKVNEKQEELLDLIVEQVDIDEEKGKRIYSFIQRKIYHALGLKPKDEVKTEKPEGNNNGNDAESDLELDPDLDAPGYEDFTNKIKYYQLAVEEIKSLLEGTGGSVQHRLAILNKHFDLLLESGVLNPEYELTIKEVAGADGRKVKLEEPVVVAENNAVFIKDLLDLFVRIGDRAARLDSVEISTSLHSIFGQLQINRDTVDAIISGNNKKQAQRILLDTLSEIAPGFISLKDLKDRQEDFFAQANSNEEVYTKALSLMKTRGNRIFLDSKVDLQHKIGKFKEKNKNTGNLSKEEQLKLFQDLRSATEPVFEALSDKRSEISLRVIGLQEILKAISEYEDYFQTISEKTILDEDGDEIPHPMRDFQIDELQKTTLATLNLLLKKSGLKEVDDLDDVVTLKSKIEEEIAAAKPQLLLYDLINKRLKDIFNESARSENLDLYFYQIEKKINESPSSLTTEEIIDYITTYELDITGSGYNQINNESHRKIIQYVKYEWGGLGHGFENQRDRDGADENFWATLEGRTAMGMLRVYGVFALTDTGDPWAEGDKEKLFESLKKMKLRRKDILQITSHPHYGPLLSKVLEVYQDLPTLRTGKLPKPDEDGGDPLGSNNLSGLASDIENGRPLGQKIKGDAKSFLRRWKKMLSENRGVIPKDWQKKFILHERLVYRTINGQEDLVKLAADRYVVDQQGNWTFYPGEELNPATDRLYLEADGRFNYTTMSGSSGKKTGGDMIAVIFDKILANPENFGLNPGEVPQKEFNLKMAKMFASFLTRAFPFLTHNYTIATLQTQTSAHPYDVDGFFYDLFDGFLGRAIHAIERYGLIDGLAHIFTYYKPFKDGIFGASGNSDRLNYIQDVLVTTGRYFFGDAFDKIAHQIDPNDPRRPDVAKPTDLLFVRANEKISYNCDLEDENGRYLLTPDGKRKRAVGKSDGLEPFDWELLQIAGKAINEIRKMALKHMERGSITKHQLESNVLNPLSQLLAKFLGQAKMYDFGAVFDNLKPILFHIMARLSRALPEDESMTPKELYGAFEKSLQKAMGEQVKGKTYTVNRGIGEGWIGKLMHQLQDMMKGEDEVFGHKPKKGIRKGMAKMGAAMFSALSGSEVPSDNNHSISGIFSTMPEEIGFDSPRYKFLVAALRSLWKFFNLEYAEVELGEFPITSEGGWAKWQAKAKGIISGLIDDEEYSNYKGYLTYVLNVLDNKEKLAIAFERPNFDKDK